MIFTAGESPRFMDGKYVVPGVLEINPDEVKEFHSGEIFSGVSISLEGIDDDFNAEEEIERIVESLAMAQTFSAINFGVHVNSAIATRPVPHIGWKGCGCIEK